MILLKFQGRTLIGCGIQFFIKWVPTWHTFGGPHSMKNEKYMKKRGVDIIIMIFHVFLIFRGARSTKSMSSRYSLEIELNLPIHRMPLLEIWVKPHGDKLKIWKTIVFFFFFSSKIWWGKLFLFYYFIIFLNIPILDIKIPLMLKVPPKYPYPIKGNYSLWTPCHNLPWRI